MSAFLIRRLAHVHRRLLSTTPPHAAPKAKQPWRPLATAAAVAGVSAAAYSLGSIYPPPALSVLFPRAAPAPPDASSPAAVAHAASLEQALQTLPLLQRLRQQPDAGEWYEARPYRNFPEERRVNNLTSGALRGAGRLAVYPLARVRRDETESYVITHVGRGLCGHDGIVHGGLLATLLDETLARTVRHILWIVRATEHLPRCVIGHREPT